MRPPGNGAAGSALHRERIPDAERVADAWAGAVRGTSFVSMSRRDLRDYLAGLAERLVATLCEPRSDHAVGLGVGEAMVGRHFTAPGSLEQTLSVLGAQFASGAVTPPQVVRLTAVLGALAAGYAQALQDRTRGEQQQISASAFAARTAAEEARWASEARFGAVFANAHIGISVAGTDGRIVEVNRALCDMFDYTLEEFLSQPIYTFIHPDDDPGVWEQVKQMTTGARDGLRLQKAYFRKDGTQIWTDLVLSLIRGQDGAPRFLVAMVQDITERHLLQTRLRHQAEHDALTGLPNRAVFFERLDEALADDAPDTHLGVCYLDLDGFKAVNDTLGHDVGDQLLCAVATRLADALSSPGHLVARMGGDEFVVLVTGVTDSEDVHRVAERALDTVRQPIRIGEHVIVISASVGVVERDDGGSGAELMKAADITLYWAKNDGRDRYAAFNGERHRVDVHRFELAAQMPDALRHGEFVVDYQPLVRLADQRLVGVEALVRWQRPDGQRLGPTQFIPIAEDTGLIVALGAHVLTEACRQARAWSDAVPSVPLLLSVNIAARQISEAGIVEEVARILRDTGWSPHALQLELTESDLMSTTGHPLEALHALAGMGVRIAIDDFGTGYSNLAYLQHLPVHELKLAGAFAATGHGDQDNIAILTALINLAHALGLTVTAEAVETAEQLEVLHGLLCDTGQGWYFAHPGAPETIAALLRAQAAASPA